MKKTVLFVTAIALVIALAATLIACKPANVEQGIGQENEQENEQGIESNEESNAINVKITSEAEEAHKQDEESKIGEKEYTFDTLHNFGVADWRNTLGGDTPVFPLSEYEELDESLQFLNGYDLYLPRTYLDEYYHGDYYFLNETLLGYVELARKGISESIENGDTWGNGIYYFFSNVVEPNLAWEQVFYAVADYYYGYGVANHNPFAVNAN